MMTSIASAGLAGGTNFPERTLQDFFKGLQRYQKHSYTRSMPALPQIWQAGQARLFHAVPDTQRYDIPVFLIPSMINKSDILDLHPSRSLLRWLAGEGFETFLFDWGGPADDEGQASFDEALLSRLIPAVESLGRPVLLLGYCMGGLFAAALSALRPELVRGCLLLATPWNFHDEKGAMKARLSLMMPMAMPYITEHRRLPESWMQAAFATLDPESTIRKFAAFSKMKEGDPASEVFVSVEDWLNEGVDLSAGIAATSMEEWYGENRPFKGEWVAAGQAIRAQDIRVPTAVVAAMEDKIVPPDAALAFAAQRLKNHTVTCASGHVGLIAGRNAVKNIWVPMREWFAAQQ